MSATEWKNPAHFRRCFGKHGYRSASRAEIQAEKASKKSGDLIIAYKCFDCGFFHIGHADRSQQIVRIPRVGRLCQECEQPIPEFKKLRAKHYNSTALYCSDACQKRAQAKRKAIRDQLQDEGLENGGAKDT
jgi:hypothetical protein